MQIFITILFCLSMVAFIVYSGLSLYKAIKERKKRKEEMNNVDDCENVK